MIDISAELGVSWRTLSRWLAGKKSTPRFQPVQVVAPTKRELVVHGPRGLRIEGIDVEGIAELVRRLG